MLVNLFPCNPLPVEKVKCMLRNLGYCCKRVSLTFREGATMGFLIIGNHPNDLSIVYESHTNGGREHFQSDMRRLKDILVEVVGVFHIVRCRVEFSSCCDDLIPDAIKMFYDASMALSPTNSAGAPRSKLHLLDHDGAMDPTVAANIVKNWRFGSGCSCWFDPKDVSQTHVVVLEAIFTNSNVDRVHINTKPSSPIGSGTLRILSSLLSSPSSTIRQLSLKIVSASAEADRALASMLETNKSLTDLNVHFDSDKWTATEMTRAMREVNCTLDSNIAIFPKPEWHSLANNCAMQLHLYVELNRQGRAYMRSITFRPEKIPILLERVGSTESGASAGRYLYPLLRENPSRWMSYYVSCDAEGSSESPR